MGQEQSTPQKTEYQHDFLTAHVKAASSMHTPTKNPLQGCSSVGADSIMLSAAKKMQQNVSGEPASSSYQGVKASVGADSFLLQEMRHAKAEPAIGRAGGAAAGYKPCVGGDSWAITQAKKAAGLQDHATRNRFNLGASLPEPHSHNDGYETAFYQDAKKVTKGIIGSKGLDSINYAGVKPMINPGDYWVEFGKTTYKYTLPDRPENWQGIRPKIPKDNYLHAQYKEKKEAIADASKPDELPAPQVDSDAYMLRLAKERQVANPTEIKTFGNPSPYHSYDDSEALMTQQIRQASAHASTQADKSAYQGVKAHLGADTFMMNFSKTLSSYSPSRMMSKEMKAPPKEVTI